jgi:hypothetical protein
MNRQTAFLSLLALGILALGSCGTKSNSSTTPASITIQVTNVPGTMSADQSASLTANVSNDTTNAGVDWSCSPAGSCGSFNPAHTASGAATVYTAPATAGKVTITAASTASKSITASADVTVIPADSNSKLNGPYVFSVQGSDSNGGYVAAGMITADGKGKITGGVQDYGDETGQAGPDAVTGNYTIGADGRGSITLDVNDTSLPNNGVETFSIALVSTAHALIIQFDGTATSSGTLDLQAPSATSAGSINGPYSYIASGVDIYNQVPLALGGVASLSAPTGSIPSGDFVANDGGNIIHSDFTGTMTGPDSQGRGTIAMSIGMNFVYYAVRGGVLRFIGSDVPDNLSGGTICAQGPAGVNSSFSNASLNGSYAFYLSGASILGPLALAGQFTADGNGNFTAGAVDTNEGGSVTGGSIVSQNVYSISGNGEGDLALPGTSDTTQDVAAMVIFATDPGINLLDPNSDIGGGGALILDIDTGAVGAGLLVPQSSGTFEGDYAINLQYYGSSGEADFVGRSVSDGSGNQTGTADLNVSGETKSGVSLSGSFTADSGNPGRGTGSLTVSGNSLTVVYYQISSSMLLILDVDTSDIGNGFLEKE